MPLNAKYFSQMLVRYYYAGLESPRSPKFMFERYTECAKRAIFFARYEAQQVGAKKIDTEHLLLGLLHDSQSRGNLLFGLKEHANSFSPEN